ncbi:hypothetical protein [Acetivibrio straminisolvens]|jgi:hypothetical protein|uniref:hypothetical protein n=1 Tax=Acetivibrio straminisolvens TaxID=253314 RepID=UPI00223FEBE2|nr:hypothetical protein [Acetivibrio straminisolvens]
MELYHVNTKNGNKNELSKDQIKINKAHTLAKKGLLALSIVVGIQVMKAMLDEEAEERAWLKGKHNKDRTVYHHGCLCTF